MQLKCKNGSENRRKKGKVEKVNGKELDYKEFVKKYMGTNQLVILTGLMDDLRACKDWVYPNGTPNLNFFSSNFGNSKVQSCHGNEQKLVEVLDNAFLVAEKDGYRPEDVIGGGDDNVVH